MMRTQRKEGEQLAIERQEREAAEKRRKLVKSSLPVAQIDFSQPTASTEEEGNQTEENEEAFSSDLAAIAVSEDEELVPKTDKCQTTKFNYMFQTRRYQVSNKDFFDIDIKLAYTPGYCLYRERQGLTGLHNSLAVHTFVPYLRYLTSLSP